MTKDQNKTPKRLPAKPFQKGNQLAKGHGYGRPKLGKDIVAARKYNNLEFERVCNKYLEHSKQDLEKILKDGKVSVFEGMHVRMMLLAHGGDVQRYELLMNRLLGKPKGDQPEGVVNVHHMLVQVLNKFEDDD